MIIFFEIISTLALVVCLWWIIEENKKLKKRVDRLERKVDRV